MRFPVVDECSAVLCLVSKNAKIRHILSFSMLCWGTALVAYDRSPINKGRSDRERLRGEGDQIEKG